MAWSFSDSSTFDASAENTIHGGVTFGGKSKAQNVTNTVTVAIIAVAVVVAVIFLTKGRG